MMNEQRQPGEGNSSTISSASKEVSVETGGGNPEARTEAEAMRSAAHGIAPMACSAGFLLAAPRTTSPVLCALPTESWALLF